MFTYSYLNTPIDQLEREQEPSYFITHTLVVFRLDLGQIKFNLVENAFATRQLTLLATCIAFYDILALACTEIKIWTGNLDEKVTYVFRLFDF